MEKNYNFSPLNLLQKAFIHMPRPILSTPLLTENDAAAKFQLPHRIHIACPSLWCVDPIAGGAPLPSDLLDSVLMRTD